MKGLRLFNKKLRINLFLIPAVVLLIALGMGEAILYVIPVLLVHEWAHALAAAALGMTITEMELLPFGCAAKMQCFAVSRAKEVIVAAAGPAANMAFASLIFIVDKYIHSIAFDDGLIMANVTVAAVNMLPALPLDGGHIAKAAFASFMGNRRAIKVTAGAGVFFAVVMAGLAVWAAVKGVFNPSLFILSFFLCLSAVKELKNAPYELIRDFSGKREAMDQRRTLGINRFAAMRTEKVGDIMREFEAKKYNIVTVLDKNMGVLGELDERQILEGMMQKGPQATLSSLYANR